jgi:hypothetical protein
MVKKTRLPLSAISRLAAVKNFKTVYLFRKTPVAENAFGNTHRRSSFTDHNSLLAIQGVLDGRCLQICRKMIIYNR